MMERTRKKYDLIVPLGGSCDVTRQLVRRGLRRVSLPFDWIGSDWIGCKGKPDTLDVLSHGIETGGFPDLCRRENLVPWAPRNGVLAAGLASFCYQDTATGWIFAHHFDRDISDVAAFERVRGTLMRRVDRLFSLLDGMSRALFVFQTWIPFDPARGDALQAALKHRFPHLEADLRIMQFKDGVEPVEDPARWGGGFFRYARDRNSYDWATHRGTNWEWSFLDDLALTGRPEKPQGLDKVRYRLYRHIGKRIYAFG